jgi:hypothetical protein
MHLRGETRLIFKLMCGEPAFHYSHYLSVISPHKPFSKKSCLKDKI